MRKQVSEERGRDHMFRCAGPFRLQHKCSYDTAYNNRDPNRTSSDCRVQDILRISDAI